MEWRNETMKMKKWIALALACVMALSLMACAGGKD
jgi:CHASE1-domain containing sensor protein